MRGKRWIAIFMVLVFLCGVAATGMGAAPQGAGEKVEVLIGFHGLPDRGVVEAFGGEVYAEYTLVDVIAARMPRQAAEALSRNPHVNYVEPDGTVYAIDQAVPWGIDRVFAAGDYGVDKYPYPAWYSSEQGDGVGVAVLDTGIDLNHEDLTVAGGRRFYIQGFRLRSDNNYNDGHGHGTHVAGTIGALDNNLGVVGVAPAVDLYAVKVLTDSGSGSVSAIIAGIEWVVNQKDIPIINMSLGSSTYSQAFKDACDAADKAGVLVVAAAGNSGNSGGTGDTVGYPAKYDSVVAVAASDSNDSRASFSSTGPAVELIAPGLNIPSTWLNNGYRSASGTSMASPHVAGVAALVWGADTSLINTDIRTILQDTAQNLGVSSNHQGYGLVRADLAVAEAVENELLAYTITASAGEGGSISPSGDVNVNRGSDQTFNIKPEEGYEIDLVLVNENPTTLDNGSYTFTNVQSNQTIHASFKSVEVQPTTYTITALADEGGSISPSGTLTVNAGENQVFTITPDNNYEISDVLVDGSSVGAVASYTFSNVSNNHTIHANFGVIPPEEPEEGLKIVNFDLTDTSNPAWARVEVSWAVTGNNLTEVELEALDSGGVTLTSKTIILSGSSASGTDELRMRNTTFTQVRITVEDASDSTSKTKDMPLP